MKRGGHRFGTRITGGLDPASMREGLASPGMDLRYWCSRGTVGSVNDAGEFDFTDPHSVWIGPEGIECDVILQPLQQRITAVWGQGGDVADLSPIHPGDQVLVECPDGDLMTPVITAILHSRSNKQPMTAGVPIFDNRRRLIYARTADINVQAAKGKIEVAAGTTSIQVNQSEVLLGDDGASHPVPKGDDLQTAINALADAIAQFVSAAGAAETSLLPAAGAFSTAYAKFQALTYLSSKVKTS